MALAVCGSHSYSPYCSQDYLTEEEALAPVHGRRSRQATSRVALAQRANAGEQWLLCGYLALNTLSLGMQMTHTNTHISMPAHTAPTIYWHQLVYAATPPPPPQAYWFAQLQEDDVLCTLHIASIHIHVDQTTNCIQITVWDRAMPFVACWLCRSDTDNQSHAGTSGNAPAIV